MGRTITERTFSLLIVVLFGATVVVPVLILAGSAFSHMSFDALIEPGILKAILNSFLISFSTAVISTLIGTVLAFLLTKTNLPFAGLMKLLLLLPLFLPPYSLAVAWSDLFLAFSAKGLINSVPGVTLILSLTYTPAALFLISASLANIHRSFEEAGEMMRTYRFVFLKIILPFIRPALLSSFSLIFVLSISEFSVPSYLSVPVLATHVFTQFTAFYNYSAAIGQSTILILICLLIIYPERTFLTNISFWSLGNKGFQLKIMELRSFSPWFLVCIGYFLLSELLPLGYLGAQSIHGSFSNLVLAADLLLPEAMHSVLISMEGALVLVLFGYVFARLSLIEKWKIIDFILLSVFAVPSTVIGIALIRFFNTPSLNFIYGSSLILVIAYLARFVFVSQKIFLSSLRQIPASYQEAALLMGVANYTRFIKIQWPLLSEGVFNAFCISFLFCFSELGASILVYPPGTSLLQVKVFTMMANSSQGLISAMNVIVLLVTLFAVALLFLFRHFMFKNSWR